MKGKSKHLGSAKPDDPIYSSGIAIHFRPGLAHPPISHQHKTVASVPREESALGGRYTIVFDYFNWEGGSCLDADDSALLIAATIEEACLLFVVKVKELAFAAGSECQKLSSEARSWRGMSGYTTFCTMYESSKSFDLRSWKEAIVASLQRQGIDDQSPIQIINFKGTSYRPVETGAFEVMDIDYSEIADYVSGLFL